MSRFSLSSSQLVDPWRIVGILKPGDGTQMSVSSFGTMFVKPSCLKWPSSASSSQLVDPWRIGGILKPGDGTQMSVSSFGTMFVKPSCLKWPSSASSSQLVDPWRIGGILKPVWMSVSSCRTTFVKHYLPQMVIIIMNNFGQAFFARNCHLPCQD